VFLAARWVAQRRPLGAGDTPAPRASVALVVKAALDELFFVTEVVSAGFIPRDRDRVRAEIRAALEFYDARGWLAEPLRYHRAPPPLESPEVCEARTRSLHFRHVRFESGYVPEPGDPARERWLGYRANRTAHAWVLEHPGAPRPWLVCVPGYRMGHPLVDFTGFPAALLHHRRGLNLVIPVLPLHGPRKVGWRSGDGFLSGEYLDTLHALSQAVWDVRRLLGWLRGRGAPAVGVYGLSLGGYTTALLAALEQDLACVILGVPATCYMSIARWNVPPPMWHLAERLGVPWAELERLVRVVSPLALSPRVPRERRFLFAALADRLVPPHAARALWHHWDRPRLAWYEGSHVSFGVEPVVQALLGEALEVSGLASAAP
jgi:hypothetical protein